MQALEDEEEDAESEQRDGRPGERQEANAREAEDQADDADCARHPQPWAPDLDRERERAERDEQERDVRIGEEREEALEQVHLDRVDLGSGGMHDHRPVDCLQPPPVEFGKELVEVACDEIGDAQPYRLLGRVRPCLADGRLEREPACRDGWRCSG